MAYTQADLDAVKSLIKRGVLSGTHNGRHLTYQSRGDLLATQRQIEAELNASSSGRLTPRFQQARFDD